MPSVLREKYPEMDWRAADKVATGKLFKRQMKVIFMADQVPEERQYALILVAGGDEAYNYWDTLEDTVTDPKQVDQVWDAFEKSFEQSTSFWDFRDAYLADFRQDPSETTADLDLHIKQTDRWCQWKKESEEERMIDLLYHATIYYEIPVCHSKVTAKTAQSPHRGKKSQPPQRHGSTGSNSGHGKGGGKCQHFKKTPKKPPKQNAYKVTFKNSVLSEVTTTFGGEREKHG